VSDRLMVMAQGRISPSIPVGEATVEQIGIWMSGLWGQGPGSPGVAAGKEGAHVQA
jgi:hypothetical protein